MATDIHPQKIGFDPYKVLKVSRTASDAQIKHAFRKRAKETHPDLNKWDKKAAENFNRVQDSYNILSDSKLRVEYDAWSVFSDIVPNQKATFTYDSDSWKNNRSSNSYGKKNSATGITGAKNSNEHNKNIDNNSNPYEEFNNASRVNYYARGTNSRDANLYSGINFSGRVSHSTAERVIEKAIKPYKDRAEGDLATSILIFLGILAFLIFAVNIPSNQAEKVLVITGMMIFGTLIIVWGCVSFLRLRIKASQIESQMRSELFASLKNLH